MRKIDLRSNVSPLRTIVRIVLSAIVVAGLTAACTGGPTPTGMAPDAGSYEYKLGAGDLIAINVFGDESLSGEQSLDGNGKLSLPLVGEVPAAGQTPMELQSTLEKEFSEYMQSPNVTVRVIEYRPFYIVGEVRNPGSYSYVDGMTVVNAVALAGGYTYRAAKDGFILQRDQENLLARDLTPVRPGDVITVQERYF
ncbi:MAG: polysaccharide biosynthesis/export family protein [Alphaproteobacteria bacterium]|nr:polysaccharide biosynthesis/export family protein [Alphaproteobacteria bacterium]